MKRGLLLVAVILISMIACSLVQAKEIECRRDSRGVVVPVYTVTGWDKFARLSKPTTALIPETPSIKEMVNKPAPKKCYKLDPLGNKLPDQTDNSGNLPIVH